MTNNEKKSSQGPIGDFALRVLIVLGLVLLIGGVLWLVCVAKDLVMLAFAGVLLAVVISWPADLLAQHTRLRRWMTLGLVLLTLITLIGTTTYLMGSAVMKQVEEQREQLPKTIQHTTKRLAATSWGAFLLEQTEDARKGFDKYIMQPETLGRVGGAITTTFSMLANTMIVFFLAIFLALSPGFYFKGLVTLAPIRARPRFEEVLHKVGNTLQWWFFGQLCSMLVIGSLTFIGLWFLGIPLALTLSVLAGVMNFIPNFGPILAAIPAVLLALTHGDQVDLNYTSALYVALWYLVIQTAEGNVITPWIQNRTVALPPALIVLFQVFLAMLVGPIGLVLATPMLAVLLVLVKMLYIEDTLGDRQNK